MRFQIFSFQNFNNMHTSDQVNDMYNKFEKDFTEIIEKHAPMKTVYKKKDQLPYMNKELRKAIYSKKMHCTKYQKNKSSKNWKLYRKSRNFVNKLKKKSLNNHFIERCTGGCKSTDFWKTIKPYLSKKACKGQSSRKKTKL